MLCNFLYQTDDFWALPLRKQGADPFAHLEALLPPVNPLQTFSWAIRKYLEQSELQGRGKEAWHLPNGEKVRSESAVYKTSTLSSEISSATAHKPRDNEGKQPGWGGVSTSPCHHLRPLGIAFPKAASPWLASLPHFCMLRNTPSAPEQVLLWSPASHWHTEHPNATTSFNATAHVCSEEVVLDFRCPGGKMLLQWCSFAHGNGWLATRYPPCHPGETGASVRTCYLHTSELPALFLAAASWNKCHRKKKKRLIKAQAMKFFWFS